MRRPRSATFATLSVIALATGSMALVASPSEPQPGTEPAATVRLGVFANLTHAPGIVAIERGLFAQELRSARLETITFNAGPAAIEALFSGALDACYIGPSPAINAYVKSKGAAVRVIAGATSGGAFLVVDPSIGSAADLVGKKVASPQLGNTQDVALRAWLAAQGLEISLRGRSDVQILPQENAQTLEAFRRREIAGAWVPEPWASRLRIEGGGKVLVDERDLWPDGRYVTTHLLVATGFLQRQPAAVKELLRAHVEAQLWIERNPAQARRVVDDAIARVTGRRIDAQLLEAAWANLEFTNDPLASSLRQSALAAQQAGLLDLAGLDLAGIYDLSHLDQVLAERGLAAPRP